MVGGVNRQRGAYLSFLPKGFEEEEEEEETDKYTQRQTNTDKGLMVGGESERKPERARESQREPHSCCLWLSSWISLSRLSLFLGLCVKLRHFVAKCHKT